MHSLLGRLCPRLADSLCAVRHSAIRAIWLTFRLGMLHRGHSPQDTDLIDSQLFDLNKFIDEHLGNEGKLDQFKARNAVATIAKVELFPESGLNKNFFIGNRIEVASISGSAVFISFVQNAG